jgi:hypothetical protein
MTAEVAVLNKTAIALAADSKSTIRIKGIVKTHETENKLFTLSKYHPVGIMINGNAEFMQRPWETIIKLYRDLLRDKSLPHLDKYIEDYLFCLSSDYSYTSEEQQSNVSSIFLDFFDKIRERSEELIDRRLDETAAVTRAIDTQRKLDSDLADLESMASLSTDELRALYSSQAEFAADAVFERLDEDQKAKLIEYGCEVLRKKKFYSGESEVIVAGFGDEEIFPALKSYYIDGIVAGRLRCAISEDTKISHLGTTAAIHPFAQREMVDRFFSGIDSEYGAYLRRAMTRIMRGTASELIEKYGVGTSEEKKKIMDSWPAPGLDDTQLGESSLPLELHRAQIPDRRVPSL